MDNIKISTNNLEEKLLEMEAIMSDIKNVLNNVHNKALDVTSDVWNSPSKNKLDELLIPFINNFENINYDLDNYTSYLKMVIDAHKLTDRNITNDVSSSDVGLGSDI